MRKEGTIVRWDATRGFGFIRSGALAQDVFVHARDYRPVEGVAPAPGLRVSFEDVHVGGKGPRAVAVRPLATAATQAGAAADSRRPADPRVASASRSASALRSASPARKDRGRPAARAPRSGAWLALPLMAGYGLALAWLVWRGQLPWWVLPMSLLLNLAAFLAYWRDKHAAQRGGWRISEDTLHLWSLAGGWGGAWFAQQLLRHKSAKQSFRAGYWGTVLLHCAGVAGLWWWVRSV